MNEPDDVLGEALLGLVRAAVAIGLERQRPEPMLRWLIDEGPAAFPDAFAPVEPATPEGHRAFATHLGVGVWNALPLPRRGFRTEPLPRPERNRPCPCGSGKKHKRCCGSFGFQPGMLPGEVVLPLVAELLPEAELPAFGASNALGPQRLAELGHHLLDTPRRAARLLEAPLAAPERLDGRYAVAIEMLLEAYHRLGWANKEHQLGETLIARAKPELQASVWLRRAVTAGDLGDFEAAHRNLDRARHCDPSDERVGPMEVRILEVEGRYEEASARARFLLAAHRRRPLADDDSETVGSLRRAAAGDFDLRHRVDLGFAGRLERFVRLVEAAAGRPVEPYDLEVTSSEEEDDDGREDAILATPRELAATEAAWRRAWPLDKPISTLPQPLDAEDVWKEETAERWLAFLEREPAAFDSLSILDDLFQAVFQAMAAAMENDALAEGALALQGALTGRAEAIVDANLSGRALRLRWGWEENRPALRLLVYRATLHDDEDPAPAIALLERLLAFDPGDSHGLRGALMDHRLRAGDDDGALALADAYPDDLLPQVLWGRVLAHFRRGERGRALTALAEAHRHLPRIGAALTSRAADRPSPMPDGVYGGYVSGGTAEAEAYAEMMGEVWASVPGLLQWLRKTRRGLPEGRR